jgi:hypothetical protein
MANILRFVILGDDRGGPAFASFTRQVEKANKAVDRNNAALGRQSAASKQARGEVSRLSKAMDGLKLNPGLLGPALALAPALTTLTGVAAGAGAALGGAFIAGAGALTAFGAVAKPVLTDAKKASDAVKKAQDAYSIAIANGTKKSVAYKAEQIAIGKAYAGMSPAQIALSKQLGGMASAWDKVKAAQAPVIAGALQPWLKSVTGLTSALGPIIAKIAPVIRDLGGQFNDLVNSSAFRGFRDFIGSTGSAAVSAGGSTIIDLVKSFMILLPRFDPLIREAVGWISRLGPAVLKWSESKKASDDITRFMQWFSKNGPAVGDLLKNIGGALKALAPGLTSGAALELKVISGFLGFVAKLPPAVAKPLAEVAGAALILNKMGGGKVISFLVTGTLGGIFGKGGAAAAAGSAAKAGGAASLWSRLTPGARLIGGALAMTLVVDAVLKSTSSGPGGRNWFDNPFGMPGPKDKASQNNWLTSWSPYLNTFKKNFAGMTHFFTGTWSTAATTVGAKADALRTKNLTPLLGEVGKVSGGIQGLAGIMQNTLLAAERAAGQHSDNLRTRNLSPLRGEVGRVSGGIQGLQGIINRGLAPAMDTGGRHADSFRTRNLGPLRGELARNSGGVQGLQHYINLLHGKNVSVGAHLSGSGGVQVTPSTGAPGARNYAVYFKPLARGGRLPGFGGGDRHPVLLESGEAVVDKYRTRRFAPLLKAMGVPRMAAGGLVGNLAADTGADVAAEARASLSAIVAAIKKRLAALNPFAGITGVPSGGRISGSAAAAQAFARSILWAYGWGQNQFPPLQALWNGESGWRWNALNASSGAYGIPQSLPASKMASAGADWRTNPATQIRWGLGYIKPVYGSPANAYGRWLGRSPHWYGSGVDAVFGAPTLIGVGERGRERVQVTPLSGGGGGGGNTYNITVNVPPTASKADTGRVIVEHIREYERGSGTRWRK